MYRQHVQFFLGLYIFNKQHVCAMAVQGIPFWNFPQNFAANRDFQDKSTAPKAAILLSKMRPKTVTGLPLFWLLTFGCTGRWFGGGGGNCSCSWRILIRNILRASENVHVQIIAFSRLIPGHSQLLFVFTRDNATHFLAWNLETHKVLYNLKIRLAQNSYPGDFCGLDLFLQQFHFSSSLSNFVNWSQICFIWNPFINFKIEISFGNT